MIQTHRHICPRNCYDTCSIISKTSDGVLLSIEGDPSHEYTQGRLCSKALDDVRKVYSPERVRYPMRQRGRFSGSWERISWDEALDTIAETILHLKQEYGTTKPIALNKYSGNFGVLHNALEELFSGLGDTTKAVGSPCLSAGADAQIFDFGKFFCSDPLEMKKAKLIWLWGVNPAWTAVHQMPTIFSAIDSGAKVICFDTHFSATAARSHRFVAVRPGTDGLLALAFAKVLLEENLIAPDIGNYSVGHEKFIDYLRSGVDLEDAVRITGVDLLTIRELAKEYGLAHPACIWAGFGLQRYTNGGQSLRAIDALAAISGHIGEEGGGIQYGQFETWRFSSLMKSSRKQGDRHLNINRFAQEALECGNPPVKMLWLASRNPLSQDGDLSNWDKLIQQLDLVVVSDLFFSKSSQAADIFLPVTTYYEHWDIQASYWHYFVGINEPAIAPVGESRSDIQIAWNISERLNQLQAGSCTFPIQGSEREAVLHELGPEMLQILDLAKPEDIFARLVRVNFQPNAWSDRCFATPSGRYEFYSARAKAAGFPALPIYVPPLQPPEHAPLRLLTPHHYSTINSQLYDSAREDYVVHLNPALANTYGMDNGERVEIWNEIGNLEAICHLDIGIPQDVLVIYQEGVSLKRPRLNTLLKVRDTDMGSVMTGAPGLALHENFVNIYKLSSGEG